MNLRSIQSRFIAGIVTAGALIVGGVGLAAPANADPSASAVTPTIAVRSTGQTWHIQKGGVNAGSTHTWEAFHPGYAGNTTCYVPGSVSVRLAIFNVGNCNHPAASSATFTEPFDWWWSPN
jgi:hypothetical protein